MSVGFSEIDDQHKHLIKITNTLFEYLKNNIESNDIKKICDDLKEYSNTHFKTEEDILRKYNFPGLETHIKEHEELKKGLAIIEDKLKTINFNDISEIISFVTTWVTDHFLTSDQIFGTFYKNIKK